jgi:glycosyltransferase involved in cell wall biosynthesis
VRRILHVGKFYPPVSGGMERVVETLCRASEGLVESRVLVMNTGPGTIEETVGGVDVTRVGTVATAGSVAISPAFAWHLHRARADLMVLHEPNPWALLSYSLVHPSIPLVIWYHSDVVRPPLQYALFYAPIARPAYRRAQRFIVSSPALGTHAAALEPYRARVRVIPFGIDLSEWDGDRDVGARTAQIAEGRPFALFAGRHVGYKGVDVLLQALRGTSIGAVIAGDGPLRAVWEKLTGDLGLQSQVRFVGDVPAAELRALMHACAVVVLPSITRAEAFGYVQLEAMACAKPVISTDVPSGVSWVNQHERTGLIVRAGDAESLRTALTRLMPDAALRERYGEAGRRRVEEEFTMAALRDRLGRLYEELGVLTPARAC